MGPIPPVCGGFPVFIEKIDLEKIREKNWLELLSRLEVGESVYCVDPREAESVRVTSYYLIKTRKLPWRFVSRKMDRGWRLIRVE
jgi:hypothetical protein